MIPDLPDLPYVLHEDNSRSFEAPWSEWLKCQPLCTQCIQDAGSKHLGLGALLSVRGREEGWEVGSGKWKVERGTWKGAGRRTRKLGDEGKHPTSNGVISFPA